MSSIARKLCLDIVDPLKSSNASTTIENLPRKLSNSASRSHNTSSKQDGKTTNTVTIEKKKVNKVFPRDSISNRSVTNKSLNKLKSNDISLKKKLIDLGINTAVTGPLRCDNDCVTMVRRRDNKCSCKCVQKRLNFRVSAKEIQTFEPKNYSVMDKACTQCIESVSCGTQFFENITINPKLSNSLKRQESSKPHLRNQFESNVNRTECDMGNYKWHDLLQNKSNSLYPANIMGAKRWALSRYPTKGPDF